MLGIALYFLIAMVLVVLGIETTKNRLSTAAKVNIKRA